MFKRMISFVKSNLKNISIASIAILALTVVSVSAYNALAGGNGEVVDQITNEYPPIEQTSSNKTIIFENPVENGKVMKEYVDDKLVEDKTTGYWQTHQAIDYAAPTGSKIYAVCDGEVESVKNDMMDGTTITLKITEDIKVVYKSMAENVSVKEGDKVKSGDELGTIGTNMTEKADGVHLHLEMYEKGVLINPMGYFGEENK